MILADYLSRHRNEDEDPADLIPVSFCRLRDVDTFCIGTRTSIKASGEKVPEIHGAYKTLDPHKSLNTKILARTKPLKSLYPHQHTVSMQGHQPLFLKLLM